MKRGDIVIVSAPGDYGKPRPAVVVQSDALNQADSILLALVTSSTVDAPFYRLDVCPAEGSGLRAASQVMVDKIVAFPRAKCEPAVGSLSVEQIQALNVMLSVMLGLAD
jgi:mRNA interferase MazF